MIYKIKILNSYEGVYKTEAYTISMDYGGVSIRFTDLSTGRPVRIYNAPIAVEEYAD